MNLVHQFQVLEVRKHQQLLSSLSSLFSGRALFLLTRAQECFLVAGGGKKEQFKVIFGRSLHRGYKKQTSEL